jgi:hypothetical protein
MLIASFLILKAGATSLVNFVASCATHNLLKSDHVPTVTEGRQLRARRAEYFPVGAMRKVGEWEADRHSDWWDKSNDKNNQKILELEKELEKANREKASLASLLPEMITGLERSLVEHRKAQVSMNAFFGDS